MLSFLSLFLCMNYIELTQLQKFTFLRFATILNYLVFRLMFKSERRGGQWNALQQECGADRITYIFLYIYALNLIERSKC